LFYPIALLIFMNVVLGFWMLYLLPKMLRIFDDFGVELPALTMQLSEVGTTIEEHGWVVSQALVAAVVLGTLVIFSPAVRWYVPVLGRLYRMSVQSRVMKMLGVLLEAGKPLPGALGGRGDSGAFAGGGGGRGWRAGRRSRGSRCRRRSRGAGCCRPRWPRWCGRPSGPGTCPGP